MDAGASSEKPTSRNKSQKQLNKTIKLGSRMITN